MPNMPLFYLIIIFICFSTAFKKKYKGKRKKYQVYFVCFMESASFACFSFKCSHFFPSYACLNPQILFYSCFPSMFSFFHIFKIILVPFILSMFVIFIMINVNKSMKDQQNSDKTHTLHVLGDRKWEQKKCN